MDILVNIEIQNRKLETHERKLQGQKKFEKFSYLEQTSRLKLISLPRS